MRILVVNNYYPAPAMTGTAIRSAQSVRALAELGTVDFFSLVKDPPESEGSGLPIARFGVARLTANPPTSRTHLSWLAPNALPLSLALHDFTAKTGRASIACIGPITAATARELGWNVQVEARSYTTEGLAAALIDYFSARR